MKSTIRESKKERNSYLQIKASVEVEWEKIEYKSLNTKENIVKFKNSSFYQTQICEFIEYWSSFTPKFVRRERPLSRESVGSHVERIANIFGFYTALKYKVDFEIVFNSNDVKSFFAQVNLLNSLVNFY